MKNSQNKPPITVPNKGKHMGGEMVRAEQFFGGECQAMSTRALPR